MGCRFDREVHKTTRDSGVCVSHSKFDTGCIWGLKGFHHLNLSLIYFSVNLKPKSTSSLYGPLAMLTLCKSWHS